MVLSVDGLSGASSRASSRGSSRASGVSRSSGDLIVIVKVKVKVVGVKSEFRLFLLFYREINRAMKRSLCWSSFVQTNYFGNFLDL